MLVLPTAYRIPKSILMGVISLSMLLKILYTGKIKIHKTIKGIFILNVLTGLFFVIYGYYNLAPGAFSVASVYIFWPILYMLYISGINNYKTIDTLIKTLIYSSIIIGIYSAMYILTMIGILPNYDLLMNIDMGQMFYIGGRRGLLEFRLYSFATIGYLFPFILTAYLTWKDYESPPVSRSILIVGLLFCLFVIAFSGRRALIALIFISPILAWVFSFSVTSKRKQILKFLVYIIIIVAISYLVNRYLMFIDLKVYWDLFVSAFEVKTDSGAMWRKKSFYALLNDWAKSPLLGYGLGAVSSLPGGGVPWAYELTYLSLLFHTGILGFLIYSLSVIWIFVKGFHIIKSDSRMKNYLSPMLAGTLGFLIINSSNPYLEKYDYLWTIFLPIAMINIVLLQYKNKANVIT
jgi:hypothetical protein